MIDLILRMLQHRNLVNLKHGRTAIVLPSQSRRTFGKILYRRNQRLDRIPWGLWTAHFTAKVKFGRKYYLSETTAL